MKSRIKFLSIGLLLLLATNLYADEKKVKDENDIRIRVKRFTLETLDTNTVDALFEVTYTARDDNFKIKVNKLTESDGKTDTVKFKEFNLSYPIQYQDFKKEINSKGDDGTGTAFTEASLGNVYIWIYLVKSHVDDNQLAGKILLARNIKVINKDQIDSINVNTETSTLRRLDMQGFSNINSENYRLRINALQAIINKYDVAVFNKKRTETELWSLYMRLGKDYGEFKKHELSKKIYSAEINNIKNTVDSLYTIIKNAQLGGAIDSLSKFNNELISQYKKIQNLQDKIYNEESNLLDPQKDIELHLRNSDKGIYKELDTNTVAFINEQTKSETGRLINDAVKKLATSDSNEKILKAILDSLGIYKIKTASLQFERGFLENITVVVERNGIEEIFENTYAIGFSSKVNYKNFDNVQLFSQKTNTNDGFDYIYLSDVILNYEYLLDNYTRDYCPADTVVYIDFTKNGMPLIELKKERLINIFDTKFYTDLEGLNENKPNGLVQIDVCKRFNLRTIRGKGILPRHNSGFLNYINLCGAISKVEKDDRKLFLRNDQVIVNNKIVSPSYATNLDFRRYEYGSFGIELNGLVYDLPDSKTTYYIDVAARYGLTKVVDTILAVDNGLPLPADQKGKEKDAHMLTLAPKIMIEILAQKKVGFTLTYQLNMSYLYSNNEYKQVVSYGKSDTRSLVLEPNARVSHMFELFVKAEVSKDANGKFFFRGRLFLQNGDLNTSFSQAQVGYAYNLFYKK